MSYETKRSTNNTSSGETDLLRNLDDEVISLLSNPDGLCEHGKRGDRLVSVKEASALLAIAPQHLKELRRLTNETGKLYGPRFVLTRIHEKTFVSYLLSDIVAFLKSSSARVDLEPDKGDNLGSYFSKSGSSPPKEISGREGGAK